MNIFALKLAILTDQLRYSQAEDTVNHKTSIAGGMSLAGGHLRVYIEIDIAVLVSFVVVVSSPALLLRRRWSHTHEEPREQITLERREVSVQSQVNYSWWRSTPRLQPLPEGSHGAWVQ